jgi:uncharacterized protein YlxW (UPF0749 family)
MNPFPILKNSPTGVVVVSLVGIVVGIAAAVTMVQAQEQKSQIARLPSDIRQPILRGDLNLAEEFEKVRKEVQNLREEKTKLENAASEGRGLAEQLNTSLQMAKLFAGLTEVEGPGVAITLRDSRKKTDELLNVSDGIIHDADVVRVINELWNAGAEAITVNGKRAGPTTSYRCVGSVIVVDGARFAAPIVIRAIGDRETLLGALNLPGGVLSEIRDSDAEMVSLEEVNLMKFPAFDGSTAMKYAQVPEDKERPKR